MLIARGAHARDCSAFTSAPFADMLEGFNRMNRLKCTHADAATRHLAAPDATPHNSHSSQRNILTEQHSNTDVTQMTERLLNGYVRTGHTKNIVRTRRKLIRSVAFKPSANAMAPPSPISFWLSFITVMVSFALCYFEPVLASAWLFAERLRSWRAPHLDKHAKVTASCTPLLPAPVVEVSLPCRACEEMRNQTMAWHAQCRVLACLPRADMFFGVVAHARSCAVSWCLQSTSIISHITTCHSDQSSRVTPQTFSVHRVSRCPSQKLKPHRQGFRCHVMATWILRPLMWLLLNVVCMCVSVFSSIIKVKDK